MKIIILLVLFFFSIIPQNVYSNTMVDAMDKLSEDLGKASENYEELEKRKKKREQKRQSKASKKIEQVINIYKSYTDYPEIINDGWHNVWMIDNVNIKCEKIKVYVKDNKVTKYLNKNEDQVKVDLSKKIKSAMSIIEIEFKDNPIFVYLFFLDK